MSFSTLNLVVLISGRGSNLQAILEAIAQQTLHARISLVISNNPAAVGLDRARKAGVAVAVVDHRHYATRMDFENALQIAIDAQAPDLIVLAGFMRVLGADFVRYYRGRLVNIHPSLLPAYPGLNTHARALAAGEKEHGATVHFVTPEVDGGPIIAQARVPVLPDDTVERLAQRVLHAEHVLLPHVLEDFAQGRVRYPSDAP